MGPGLEGGEGEGTGEKEENCFSGFNFSEEKLRKKFLIEDFIFSVETKTYLQKVLLTFRGH